MALGWSAPTSTTHCQSTESIESARLRSRRSCLYKSLYLLGPRSKSHDSESRRRVRTIMNYREREKLYCYWTSVRLKFYPGRGDTTESPAGSRPTMRAILRGLCRRHTSYTRTLDIPGPTHDTRRQPSATDHRSVTRDRPALPTYVEPPRAPPGSETFERRRCSKRPESPAAGQGVASTGLEAVASARATYAYRMSLDRRSARRGGRHPAAADGSSLP